MSASCLSSTKCFIKKKIKIVTEAVFLFLSLHAWDTPHACEVLCFYSLIAVTNHHVLCIFHILFYLQHLIISLAYILVIGFSWTFACSSYSYPLASTTLAEVTASATSGAQTTPERARVIHVFRWKSTEVKFNQEELQWLYHHL